MIEFFRKNHLSPWIVPGALVITGLLYGLCGLTVWLNPPGEDGQTAQAALLTSLPASTSTIVPAGSQEAPPTSDQGIDTKGIAIDLYVQISNTGGDGLKLRSGPGISSPARFLGKEAEVFQVKDGPRVADGFVWWYLVTPYDEHRSGWAVSDYLTLIAQP